MSELSKQKLEGIANSTGNLVSVINEGVTWVNTYLEGKISEKLAYGLKQHRRRLNKVKSAIVQKPTISLFGQSQVGKSYLVKNMLSDTQNELLIPDLRSQTSVNFIKEINPDGGGKESTSLVTRFSYNPTPDLSLPPVKIRFLSASDLLMVLLDSYYSDFSKRKESFNIKLSTIEALLATLPNYFSSTPQKYLNEDDVYDIEEYLADQFKPKHPSRFMEFENANYWNIVAKNIHKIHPDNWSNVFSILYGDLPEFSQLFNLLVKELERIDFSKELYGEFDTVKRSQGAILDVTTLEKVYVGLNYNVKLIGVDKRTYSIDPAHLCAISAEVIFNISEDSLNENKFIEQIDILDFPGARGREVLDESSPLTEEKLTQLLLRGKVSYLFNSYSFRYEINNLFVCHNGIQIEVRTLPDIFNSWIKYNIGEDAAARSVALQQYPVPPLFIIFTWWNNEMVYDKDNDKFEDKIKKRFQDLFEKDIKANNDWAVNWTLKDKFRNVYLLRDYKYSKDVFAGFEATGAETGVNADREAHYKKIKDTFVSSNLVKDFFSDPEEVWQNTSVPGMDGSKYIIKNIGKINSNQVRINRYLHIINTSKQAVQKLLVKHFHSDDKDKEIINALREASEIHAVMNRIFGEDAFQFGNFIEHFTMQEKDIFEFYHDKLTELEMVKAPALKAYQLYREGSPDLSSNKTDEENLAILMRDYRRDSIEDTRNYFENILKIDLRQLFSGHLQDLKNASQVLAEGARNFWFEKKLNTANFEFIIEKGVSEELLEKLFKHMKNGFNNSKIVDIIAANIRTYVDTLSKIDLAQDMIAHITAGIINEYATSCGWTFYAKEHKQKIRETNAALKLNIDLPDDELMFNAPDKYDTGVPGDMSLEEFIECMANMNEHLNKVPPDMKIIKLIPMVKNYRNWRERMKICFIANSEMPTYDPKANQELGSILDEISQTEISLA